MCCTNTSLSLPLLPFTFYPPSLSIRRSNLFLSSLIHQQVLVAYLQRGEASSPTTTVPIPRIQRHHQQTSHLPLAINLPRSSSSLRLVVEQSPTIGIHCPLPSSLLPSLSRFNESLSFATPMTSSEPYLLRNLHPTLTVLATLS